MSSRKLWLLVTVVVAGCVGTDRPVGIGTESSQSDPIQPELQLDAGVAATQASFAFLPPLGTYVLPSGASVDRSLSPEVVICATSVSQCTASNAIAHFTRSMGTAGETILVPPHGEFFEVEWQTQASPVQVGDSYRIHAKVLGVTLGTIDVALTSRNGSLPIGSTPRIRFFADSNALREALGCIPGSATIIDCDVVQVVSAQGNTATVYDATGRLAARITIPAALANQDHVLQVEHRSVAPAPAITGQFPYHLTVKTITSDGSPVAIGGSGARIVVCQDPSIDQTLPHSLHDQLEILRVNGATVQRMPTTPGAPECSLTGPLPAPIGSVASTFSPARIWSEIYRYLAPTPLRALHGGLNTSSGGFSDFTAVLSPNSASSTANAQVGTLGAITTVMVQARTALGTPFTLGGDAVAMTVTGSNPASTTATDLGGGLYRLTYVPQAAGADTIWVTFNGQPVGAGPLVVQNQSSASHLVEAVVRFGGVGVAGIRIVVEGPIRVEGVTDGTGNARFAGLPAGVYEVGIAGDLPGGSVVSPSNPQAIDLPTDSDTGREVVFDVNIPG